MTQVLYVGTIVQESLSDISFLDTWITIAIEEIAETNPLERWHLYTVVPKTNWRVSHIISKIQAGTLIFGKRGE